MSKLVMRLALAAVGGILFHAVFAADIPQVNIESQNFNKEQCIDDNTQACINGQCLTSDATDCQEKCQKQAAAVCKQQSAE